MRIITVVNILAFATAIVCVPFTHEVRNWKITSIPKPEVILGNSLIRSIA